MCDIVYTGTSKSVHAKLNYQDISKISISQRQLSGILKTKHRTVQNTPQYTGNIKRTYIQYASHI